MSPSTIELVELAAMRVAARMHREGNEIEAQAFKMFAEECYTLGAEERAEHRRQQEASE